ncbi:MAG: ATP-binding protein, partial [Verrucomicrobia bacterium]|nr:ATP-binding protein [Verrucomicrobiota bacterium]
LSEVLDASERAAILTRQLLTFSRKHLFQPAPINLIELLERQTKLLRRIVGEQIQLESDCPGSSIGVVGDEPSLEQVLMNLVINARDAMPNGGKLRVSARPETISGTSFANPGATAGDFVRIDVCDEGIGIEPCVLARIFEPFYTTKDVGCGTGMGLATVYGIVQQHHGWIDVASEPGRGSTFSVFLPACEVTKAVRNVVPESEQPKLALQVLLVEDEPAVRAVMKRLLMHSGCSVIEAPDAHKGLQMWRQNRDTIDLLVTDIVMPGGMSGHDLARQIHSEAPDLKVIFCSGYSADLFGEDSELVPGKNFLPKPYSAASVVSMLHSVALGTAAVGI